jgi:hypothetical protein
VKLRNLSGDYTMHHIASPLSDQSASKSIADTLVSALTLIES